MSDTREPLSVEETLDLYQDHIEFFFVFYTEYMVKRAIEEQGSGLFDKQAPCLVVTAYVNNVPEYQARHGSAHKVEHPLYFDGEGLHETDIVSGMQEAARNLKEHVNALIQQQIDVLNEQKID